MITTSFINLVTPLLPITLPYYFKDYFNYLRPKPILTLVELNC